MILCLFVGTLLMDVPETSIGASFLEFELKPTGKESEDPTQYEFQSICKISK